MYFYFKFKNIIGLKEIYTELLIYLGYAIGLLIGYGSMLSTFIYIIEHMVVNKDINFFSNIGPIVFAIPFIYYLVGEKENLIKIDKLSFKIKSFGYIALFSVLMGVISFLFLKSINFMFNTIKKSKFNNLYVIGFGFILACILKKNGFISLRPSQQYINEEFQASINREKLKKLEEENNYDELEKLKKLENEGKFNTDNKFNLTFLLTRLVNCATGLSAGLIGGFIIPSITIGCVFGSVLSEYTNVSQKNLMFLGMIAFLSPFLGTPITSALLVNKISNQKYDSLPLSISVSFISYFTYTLLKKRFF
jgi:H+/Cl- antiporter ClcA